MMTFNSGDIWYARVYFEDDISNYKIRPVFIISDNMAATCAKITSHCPRSEYEYEYEIIEWQHAGLAKPSTIRLSQILSIPHDDLLNRIGRLDSVDILNVQKLLLQM